MYRCLPELALKQRPKVIRKRPIETIGKLNFSIKRADKGQMEYTIAKRTITKNRFVSVRSHETPAQSQTNIATKTKKMYERELRL